MTILEIDCTTQVDLLRHGECEGGGIFCGTTDPVLSREGMASMRRTCDMAAGHWDLIVSSPLKRCLYFAKHFGGALSIPVVAEPRLREMSFGDWEAQEIEQVWRHDEARVAAWSMDPLNNTPPNGESLYRVSGRVVEFYSHLIDDQRGKKVLVVTHGGIIRVLLAHILGMPLSHANRFDVPCASMSRFKVFHSGAGDITKILSHNFSL